MGQPISISCSKEFRDEICALAERRKVSVAALLRAVYILLPLNIIEKFEDPGEPTRQERDIVVLKSGAQKGQTIHRKPRLQLRLPTELEGKDSPSIIRRALALAIALERQEWQLSIESASQQKQKQNLQNKNDSRMQELERGIERLAFVPLNSNCRTLEDACYILGIRAGRRPTEKLVRQRFRDLASVFHPDAINGDNERMSQINQAMRLFKEYNIIS